MRPRSGCSRWPSTSTARLARLIRPSARPAVRRARRPVRHGPVEELAQPRGCGAVALGRTHRRPHLAEDLVLPDEAGVQPGRDGEQVLDGVLAGEHLERAVQVLSVDPRGRVQPLDECRAVHRAGASR